MRCEPLAATERQHVVAGGVYHVALIKGGYGTVVGSGAAEGDLPIRLPVDCRKDVLIAARAGSVVDGLGVGIVERKHQRPAAMNHADVSGVTNTVGGRIIQNVQAG